MGHYFQDYHCIGEQEMNQGQLQHDELSFFINSQLLFLIKLSPGFCKVLFSSSASVLSGHTEEPSLILGFLWE